MSVGGASAAGGAAGASTGTSTTSSTTTTTSGGGGATATSGAASQTAQANAAVSGASISGQTETSNSRAATGDPAALGQQSFTVDANAIASLPAAQQALAVQFSVAIVQAQQEEMARAQQPAVPAGIAVTDPSMVQRDNVVNFQAAVLQLASVKEPSKPPPPTVIGKDGKPINPPAEPSKTKPITVQPEPIPPTPPKPELDVVCAVRLARCNKACNKIPSVHVGKVARVACKAYCVAEYTLCRFAGKIAGSD